LQQRFPQAALPKIVFTDRGRGFYATSTGKITNMYKQALTDTGMRPFAGEDASDQPGSIGDVLLHETAVAWIRQRLIVTTPQQSWKEDHKKYGERLRDICRYINDNYYVAGLCREFPDRLRELKKRSGDRLTK
jgi:hypothetical protein